LLDAYLEGRAGEIRPGEGSLEGPGVGLVGLVIAIEGISTRAIRRVPVGTRIGVVAGRLMTVVRLPLVVWRTESPRLNSWNRVMLRKFSAALVPVGLKGPPDGNAAARTNRPAK